MNKEIYSHFHPEEHGFIDQVFDWMRRASERHVVKLTDFLDPRQAFIVESITRSSPFVQCELYGGYEEAERKRAWIAPDYMPYSEQAFELSVLSIGSMDTRFAQLDHSDFLGAVLGLGIKRDKIGDIHVHEEECHLIVCNEMIPYIQLNLQKVHQVSVWTNTIPLEQLKVVFPTFEERTITVSSLRFDAIVSDLIRMSRAKTLPLIRAGDCRLNWKTEENPSRLVNENDIISVRGHGRFKVIAIEGMTKKGNHRVKVGKFT